MFYKGIWLVFLGTGRHQFHHTPVEADIGKLIPMYAVVLLIMAIGLFPKAFIEALSQPLILFTHHTRDNIHRPEYLPVTGSIIDDWIMCSRLYVIGGLIFLVRRRITINKPQTFNVTWGCGYVAPTGKMQYTASSFIRAYRKLAEPLLSISKKKKEIKEVFPKTGGQETHPYDKAEEWFIDYPLLRVKKIF